MCVAQGESHEEGAIGLGSNGPTAAQNLYHGSSWIWGLTTWDLWIFPEGTSWKETVSVSILFMNHGIIELMPAFKPTSEFQQMRNPNLSDLPPVIQLKIEPESNFTQLFLPSQSANIFKWLPCGLHCEKACNLIKENAIILASLEDSRDVEGSRAFCRSLKAEHSPFLHLYPGITLFVLSLN